MSKRALVIGGSGLVGSRFIKLSKKLNQILAPSEKELDIASKASVDKYFKDNADKFGVVINFAAYTDVGGAEKERGNKKGIVWKLNVDGAENVARASQKYGKFLIHISTDFVFEGTKIKKGPYKEDAKLPRVLDKISWYGWTKLVGEKMVQKYCSNSAIVRIAYPFSAEYGQKIDFARNILELYDEGRLYPLFTDQIITPLFVDELVKPLEKLVELERSGIYHVVTLDSVSYYEFGEYLVRKARGEKNAPDKGSLVEFLKIPGRNPRPIYGGLDTEKTQVILGMKFGTWKQTVDKFVRQLRE